MYKRSLEFKFWDARFYLDKDGNLRNKIRRGWGKNQQKDEIATTNTSEGYLVVNEYIDGKQINIYAHRLAVLLHTGDDPGDQEVNHRNQDKTDNRIQNLEVLDRADHARKHPKRSDCSSGCTGVSWHKRDKVWVVQIHINGKNTAIGRSKDFDEAVKCRKAAEKKYGYFPEHGKTREEVQKLYEDKETAEEKS